MPPAATRKKPARHDKRLGRILRDKRTALKNTPDYPDPERVGERVGMSQTNIYRLETGEKSLRSLTGEQTVELLRAYGFRSSEIEALMKEHDLNAPAPRPAQTHELPLTAQIPIPFEGTINEQGGHAERVGIPEWLLAGHNPALLRARFVGDGDYATSAARSEVRPHIYVVIHPHLEPVPGDLCIYRGGDLQYLGVSGRDETGHMQAFDPDLPTRRIPENPTLVGVVVSERRFV